MEDFSLVTPSGSTESHSKAQVNTDSPAKITELYDISTGVNRVVAIDRSRVITALKVNAKPTSSTRKSHNKFAFWHKMI